MRLQYLELFKNIGSELQKKFPNIYKSENKGKIVGNGKGGDKTTLIDRFAEDIIVKKLEDFHKRGNDFTLISEELGTRKFGKSDNMVLVDPLDGSVNAKRGLPFFSVSIAFIEGEKLKETKVGYVLNLMNNDEFYAVKGSGAFLNNEKIRIKNSKNSELGIVGIEAPIKDSLRYITKIGKFSGRVRIMGSVALDLCYTASEAFDVCVFPFKSRSVDFAAGKLILEEAGGIISDFNGENLDKINAGVEKTTEIVCAKNKELHEKILGILH